MIFHTYTVCFKCPQHLKWFKSVLLVLCLPFFYPADGSTFTSTFGQMLVCYLQAEFTVQSIPANSPILRQQSNTSHNISTVIIHRLFQGLFLKNCDSYASSVSAATVAKQLFYLICPFRAYYLKKSKKRAVSCPPCLLTDGSCSLMFFWTAQAFVSGTYPMQ